jgi:hypothetical protein
MEALISMADAVQHLNLDFYDVALLELKIMEASSIVLKRLKLSTFPDAWADDLAASPILYTVPYDIHACAIGILGILWLNRETDASQDIEKWLQLFLTGHRDPTLA